MLILGLTGVSGSGKSYVSAEFAKLSIPVVNTDEITHAIYSGKNDCTDELCAYFGSGILKPDGSVDRKALGRIVFADREKLEKLNLIVHKYVLARCDEIARKYREKGAKALLVEAPQLFEAGFDRGCDRIIAVVSDPELDVERIMKRDNLTREEAEARIKNQKDNAFFIERADFVIYNNGGDVSEAVASVAGELGIL